ncbi:uncharacterized protein LOC119600793 [Lucilia sericata]|uniref:uncharacterized protein LOC119600793 n=1 Tax=Lucilia sericata TaxID=13632 RepID=UPI0018A7EFB9|nr:uncharacterized protein LOC119600793 [Lucilia sericata]
MDDLLTGADTLQECKKHLEKFGFHLRKWISNKYDIVRSDSTAENNEVLDIQEDECLKTLGLQWNPTTDNFTFRMQPEEDTKITKRIALSRLARIFDPLGWLTPITVTAKLFIQQLWRLQSNWDEPLDENLSKEWNTFSQSLPAITEIKIKRWIPQANQSSIQLHGLADASEKAYAAVVYAKTSSSITIVAAKSKVNPIKNRKTLPKLELCAAHLLAKLLNKVKRNFNSDADIYAWSDSMITLSWIKKSANKEKFIRTRVSEINQLMPNVKWGYVKSKENPADIGSRGINPEKLERCSLWWLGPEWLQTEGKNWPSDEPEIKVVTAIKISQPSYLHEVTSRFSSYRKMKRVFAYVLRFIRKIKGDNNFPTFLTTKELDEAEILIVKLHQMVYLPNELIELKNKRPIDHRSKIAALNPQLDEHSAIRVGGRLEFSDINYNMKHPIIIQKSQLADLIVRDTHYITLHGGNRLMENIIRRNYWIIDLKNRIKKCIHTCVKCIRFKQEQRHQLMGLLPAYRVNISQPFAHCGIDYAGPIQIKCSNGRGQKSFKGYVAVFVCMATKAVHLEAVSNLTTEAFLAALKRFFDRRGKSNHIYSDNGTNFIGAARQTDKEFVAALKNNSTVAPLLEEDKIQWHFIPPASPHFGGIWEAAVKSMKYHMKRIIGEHRLTFEEMTTLLTQIEAVLNSRPLHQLDSCPDSIETLTPGHFLIGRPMMEYPEKNDDFKVSCLDRWKLLQKLKNHFWKKWKIDYLSSLQQRSKWKKSYDNLEKGQVVIIKNEETYPARWPLGKVIDIHPGKDDIVRVVTLKTKNGILKRPIHKLCPLEHRKICEESLQETSPETTALTMNVREIKPNTAIYLDTINQINVVSSSWNLVVYYEMRPYFEVLNRAVELLNQSKEICPKLDTFKDQCWSVITNMEYQVNKLETNNGLFLNNKIRKRRDAPLKFIGSLHHVLFGLMDEDDRESLENNMKNLLANQEDLKVLSKKQTSVVDSTY